MTLSEARRGLDLIEQRDRLIPIVAANQLKAAREYQAMHRGACAAPVGHMDAAIEAVRRDRADAALNELHNVRDCLAKLGIELEA